jgi:tetratricopeptide (TPR) repeat protein
MLIEKGPTKPGEMSVMPTPVEVVLAEDISGPLSLTLPPLEDMNEMHRLSASNFSLTDLTQARLRTNERWFRDELKNQLRKEGVYGHSPAYLERLANLALLAGDPELEAGFLERVLQIDPKGRALHRLGENFISRELSDEAEALFRSLDLLHDVHANLRIAFFCVRRNDIASAEQAVKRAIEIKPFDYSSRLFNGSLNLVQGKFGEAIHNFRVAEEEKPNSAVLHANMAIAYALMKNNFKALASAKRAVALDPLNQNAVCILSDLANSENCNDDAIPALRYLAAFEQKNAGVWSRLARALLSIGSTDEAIAALRRQGSIVSGAEVFNSLGVAYHRKGRGLRRKAYDSFKHAALSDEPSDHKMALLASRNICALLLEDREYKDLAVVARAAIASDQQQFALSDRMISDLYVFRILGEMHGGRMDSAAEIAHKVLGEPSVNLPLSAWVVSWLIAYYSLRDDGGSALRLVKSHSSLIGRLSSKDHILRNMLVNNIAFAFAELGRVDDAENYLQLVSNRVHVDPYPTATLGLLHIRRGHIDRALVLYEEAIGLAKTDDDKARIRQKLNLELGQHHFLDNRALANRFLDKAIAQKDGAPELSKKALTLRRQLLGSPDGR